MFIGEVVGTVVANTTTENVEGLALRLVRRMTTNNAATDSYVVAIDILGTSNGEVVLVTSGSAARNTQITDMKPVDAVIMAIVDTWQVDGQVHYTK